MRPVKIYVPGNVHELIDFVIAMQVEAPKFVDKSGYFPFRNLDYVFRQLREGLAHNRQELGDERYLQLLQMSDHMRALFIADPEDGTGESRKGRDMIYEIEDILREVPRKT